jgi:hypothetical protein
MLTAAIQITNRQIVDTVHNNPENLPDLKSALLFEEGSFRFSSDIIT